MYRDWRKGIIINPGQTRNVSYIIINGIASGIVSELEDAGAKTLEA